MGIVLFACAGTLAYRQAWIFLAVYACGALAVTVYLLENDPKLLERRLQAGPGAEKEFNQKIVMCAASIGFVALLAVSAFDHRERWSDVPFAIALLGDVLVIAGLAFVTCVFRENSFTSATIEVAADQHVVTSGPYALVRHPMYAGALLYLAGMPIALGSWWGIAVMLLFVPILMWRLLEEETFLVKNLAGYVEYRRRVKYRLVPFVW